MEGAVVDKIAGLAGPKVIEVEGKSFSNESLVEVKPDPAPLPKVISIHTLTGLIDYIRGDLDDAKKYVIHVLNQEEVCLYGELETDFGRRKKYCEAIYEEKGFEFGSWMDQEQMVINLQAQFVMTKELSEVLKQVSNVADESRLKQVDDGISQEVSLKTGIGRLENATLKNPVSLAPYRTFPEIEQIESDFILRMKKSDAGSIYFALFQSGGAAWKLEAVHRIRDYLLEHLGDVANIVVMA